MTVAVALLEPLAGVTVIHDWLSDIVQTTLDVIENVVLPAAAPSDNEDVDMVRFDDVPGGWSAAPPVSAVSLAESVIAPLFQSNICPAMSQ